MIGEIFILIAAFTAALYYKMYQKIDNYHPMMMLFWQAIIMVTIMAIFFGGYNVDVASLSISNWLQILALAGIVTFGGYCCLFMSARKVGALKSGTLDFLEPIVGVVLAMLIFTETLTWYQGLGWLLIFLAVFNVKKIK